jgi:hypothetical protein
MLEAKVVSARIKKNFFYLASLIVGVFGPIAVIASRFNLYVDSTGVKLTFLGMLILLVVINFLRKDIVGWIHNLPTSIARSILLTLIDAKWWLILLLIFIFVQSERFYSYIDVWYEVIWFSLLLSIAGGFLKRMHEYYLEFILDRRKYLKFKDWDKE